MGVRTTSVSTNSILGGVPATGVETVIFTTPPISQPLDGAVVFLFWELVATIGAGTTGSAYRLRRGTTTAGVVINVIINIAVTAGSVVKASGVYFDNPGGAAGLQYSLTQSGAATTGAFTTQDGSLLAMVL